MSLDAGLDPQLDALLRAIGLLDEDSQVDTSWFDDPIGALRSILSDAGQRAGLRELLDATLGASGDAPDGSTWHPLLEPGRRGNVYLTVTGEKLGVAAELATPAGEPVQASAGLRLDLIDTQGDLRAIAGTPDGPLEVVLDLALDDDAPVSALRVRASVDLSGNAALRFALEGVGDGDETIEVSSEHFGRDLVRAVEVLVRDALGTGGDPLAEHLLGALGLEATPPLPVERLVSDPAAARTWFAQLAGNPGALADWFAHLAGLLGATVLAPRRARLVSLGGVADLTLGVQVENGALEVVLGVEAAAAGARLEASAVALAIPLLGSAPVRVVPSAAALVRAGGDGADFIPPVGGFRVGSLRAGLAFDGVAVVPELVATGVSLDGTTFDRLDLSSANAIVGTATAALRTALEDAIGDTGPGRALLSLAGLLAPRGDPGSPHVIDAGDLAAGPTRAIAEVHRGALADSAHPWRHLFAELTDLLGLPAPAPGAAGTAANPWSSTIASAGELQLDLIAWNAAAGGEQRLRIGLRVTTSAALAPWQGELRSELLAFELPASAPAAVRLIGEQRIDVRLTPLPATPALGGITVSAGALRAGARWQPGTPLTANAAVVDVVVDLDGAAHGPLTLTFPSGDASSPSLGIGAAVPQLLGLLRALARYALQAWGSDALARAGELLGLVGDGPLLEPPDPADLGSLLERPGEALRAQLRALVSALGADGLPYAWRALDEAAALLGEGGPGVRGAGTYEDPWALPLAGSAEEPVELIGWLEPAGPPHTWAAPLADRIAAAQDPHTLLSLLDWARALVPGLPRGGDADALREFAEWLALGDGVSPLVDQLPDLPGWQLGDTLHSAHDAQPRDPAAIAQIAAQLMAWAGGGPRAALLVGPPWSTAAVWSDLLAAVEPGRPAGAHFDLRAGAAPAAVTAVASHYTADLDGDDPASLAAQIAAAADRVLALTGRAQLALVAHSTAGVPARMAAETLGAAVSGIITLGTPHAGQGPPAPTDAVRVARDLAGAALAGTALGAALERLEAGGVRLAAPPEALGAGPPGLALGSALGGDLGATLAEALAARVRAGAPARPSPTHLGFGLRAATAAGGEAEPPVTDAVDGALAALFGGDDAGGAFGGGDAGGAPGGGGSGEPTVRLDAAVRIDAGRVRFVPETVEPERPPRAVGVELAATRPGGWLAGDPDLPLPRVRAAELAVTVVPAPGGTVVALPRLTLRDAVLDGPRLDLDLGDPGFARALELLDLGPLDFDALTALADAPGATLRARRDALLDALETLLGGPLAIAAPGLPLELSLDRATWALRVRTTAELELADGIAATLDGRLDLRTLVPSLGAGLRLGAVRLERERATGELRLAAAPWLAPLTLLPAPTPQALRAALAPLIPRLALSSVLSAALADRAGGGRVVAALDPFLADPAARLAALDGTDIQNLLQAAAQMLGVEAADGLGLPGGFNLRASGAAPLHVALTGTLALPAGAGDLGLGLSLDIAADRTVTPGGTLDLDVALPGTWGRVAVAFGASAAGVTLSVTPQGTAPIHLLPQFSGFGALLQAGTTSLLPHLLQAIVEELRPAPNAEPAGFPGAVLDLAEGLGVYGPDAQGFEAPARATRLAAMLQPGWLETQLADPAAIADLIAGLFGAGPLLPVPGTIAAAGSRVTWTGPLPAGGGGATLSVDLGPAPAVHVGVANLDLGPLIIVSAEAGFDGAPSFAVTVRLDADGDVAFLRPEAELGISGSGRFGLALLPLGAAHRADLELALAPSPHVVFTEQGALDLITAWGFPLVALIGLKAATDVLDTRLWTGGPTSREILAGARLIGQGTVGTPQLADPLPALETVALGAVDALATGLTNAINALTVDVGDLKLAIVADAAGRKGLRLKGSETVAAGDVSVELRFGHADWLTDPAAGVTLWLVKPAAGTIPFALDLALDAIGIGALLGATQADEKLLDGPVAIGRIGGLLFFELDFLDAVGNPALTAGGIGGAVEVEDAQIAISSDDGDSFIQKLLPKEMQGPFALAVEKRAGQDLRLHGGIVSPAGRVELTFPLDLDIGGIVQLDELFLSAGSAAGVTDLLAAISGGAALGPVAIAVERVGVRARFAAGTVSLSFKPPDGLGLSIDSPAIKLGGYLFVDEVRGRYVGAIELAIAEKFALVGVGIVTTKKPDGSPGFSLLLLISITFPVPIPLGYGFFFAGAGGLLGLNRGVDLDRLRLGLRSGTADSILFPTDVVRRIDTIVRDLEEVFPAAEGRFLVAPMAMITWSTPALITAKVGLIIEIGSPLRLALLGALQMTLPTADAAVVKLKVAFMGAIDIPASLLSFDASIYDSFIGFGDFKLSLEGDFALRICWGPQPDFVTTLGGFHPNYRPAAHLRLPPLRRLSLSLLKDNPRITLSCYFAVTSNSVQFGAKLELVAKAGGFSLEGELGLDVLVQIQPFRLEAHIWGRLSVRAGGSELLSISLDLTLEGPTPWIARGKGKFKILFFSVEVSFTARIGEAAPSSLPEIAVLPLVLDALAADGAWSSQLGRNQGELVHLIERADDTLVLDAGGILTVSQRVLPLGTDFSRFGTARPSDVTRVSVQELRIGTRVLTTRSVEEAFAPAAFRDLSDAERLSAPAFERRAAGVQSVSGDALVAGGGIVHAVAYETIVYDSVAQDSAQRGRTQPAGETFSALVPGGAVGHSPLSTARARQLVRDEAPVKAAKDRYAVTRLGDARPLADNGQPAAPSAAGVLLSLTDAEARRDALARDGATDLQVLPEAQLAA